MEVLDGVAAGGLLGRVREGEEDEAVRPGAAGLGVGALAAGDVVVAGEGVEQVVERRAVQRVVAIEDLGGDGVELAVLGVGPEIGIELQLKAGDRVGLELVHSIHGLDSNLAKRAAICPAAVEPDEICSVAVDVAS